MQAYNVSGKVGYDHLIRLEREFGIDSSFLPERAERKYTVRELLEGVRDDPVRQRSDPGKMDAASSRDASSAAFLAPTRRSGSQYRGKVDFGIVTIREDECTAVLSRFAKVTTEEQRRRYRIRSLALPGGSAYTLAVLRCVEQGNTDALNATRDLLEDLAPRFVLVIGIAGGVPSHEVSLGDVVVSTRIVDFSVEAVIHGHEQEHALSGGPLHPAAARLAADIGAMAIDGELGEWNSPEAIKHDRPPIDLGDDRFYGDAEWQQSVRQKISRQLGDDALHNPRAIAGVIASSDRLIKDDKTLAGLLKSARHVVAVEMESAGIYKAVHGRVPFLAIRGISDVIGLKRDPKWTTYACATAAAFAHALLLTRPFAPVARK